MANQQTANQAPAGAAETAANPVAGAITNLNSLPLWRRLALLTGLVATLLLAGSVVLWLDRPSMAVLYANLSQKDLSMVREALERDQIPFSVGSAGTVLVPVAQVHDLRLRLAADGLPRGITAAFDGTADSSGIGVSQFMEAARYYRALELELSRSIMTLSNVESARVHVAVPKQGDSADAQNSSSASVVLNLFPGRTLAPGQVAAIVHLVAASIPDLAISGVTVVDQRGNLLTDQDSNEAVRVTRAQLVYTRELEQQFVARIVSILEPLVGRDSVRAQVTAQVSFNDTGSSAAVKNTGGKGLRGARGGEQSNGAGRLQRLSVAVVLDDKSVTSTDGSVSRRTYSPEEINQMRLLVQEAVGFDVARGDSVSVVNAAFNQQPVEIIEPPEVGLLDAPGFRDQLFKLFGMLVIAVVMWKVLKPALVSLATPRSLPPPAVVGGSQFAISASPADAGSPGGQAAERVEQAADGQIDKLRRVAQSEPGMVAQVIKTWVAEGN